VAASQRKTTFVRRRRILLITIVALISVFCSCAKPTPTPYPTYTPNPTYTSYPTYTPYPTHTMYPTCTSYPTYTPYPTWTPTATHTPTYTATPTATVTPSTTPSPTPVMARLVIENVSGKPLQVTLQSTISYEFLVGLVKEVNIAPGQYEYYVLRKEGGRCKECGGKINIQSRKKYRMVCKCETIGFEHVGKFPDDRFVPIRILWCTWETLPE